MLAPSIPRGLRFWIQMAGPIVHPKRVNNPDDLPKDRKNYATGLMWGAVFGIAGGAAFGAALGDMGTSIGVGVGIGMGLGVVFALIKTNKSKQN